MGLTIYTGSAGSGKTYRMLSAVIEASLAHPETDYLILVPEQFTMQTQKELLRLHPRHGTANIDVLSLNRLAYRVFEETGTDSGTLLEEIGKSFLIEKVVLEKKKTLRYFGEQLARPASVQEMKSVISELLLYDVTSGELRETADSVGNGAFAAKLSDVAAIYDGFREKLAGRYMTAEEVPDVLCGVIERSDALRSAVIALDGFTGFTPVQKKLLEKLIPMVRDCLVTVTIDPDTAERTAPREGDLFAMSRRMLRDLYGIAKETDLPVHTIPVRDDGRGRFSGAPSLSFLEQHLFRGGNAVWGKKESALAIVKAGTPRGETAMAARLIRKKVREDGLRYREIAVITGDLATYGAYVREIFPVMEIPVFVDEKRALVLNPFIEYTRAALEACATDYSYDGMFRMLKAGMTDLTDTEIQVLENYVLGEGIRGRKRWRSEWVRTARGEDPAEVPAVNQIREKVCALLDPLADEMRAPRGTVRKKTVALYEFFVRSLAEQRLRARAEAYAASGDQENAREYTQVYPYVIHLLEKLVDTLGDERISMRDYCALLDAGFSEARIGLVPPACDQVLVGDMERSRLADIRCLIFLGVNEGLLPKNTDTGGILSESDRERLDAMHLELKPTPRQAIEIERFYLYLSLTKPSGELILSCSQTQSDGSVLRPAYLIEEAARLFPLTKMTEFSPCDMENMEHPEEGMRVITETARTLSEKAPAAGEAELFRYFKSQRKYAGRAENLLAAAGIRKERDRIGREAAKRLYGTELRNSASRLEQYYGCMFAHFLTYGLKLRPRPEYTFTGMDLGNILHRSLEIFAKSSTAEGERWQDLGETERNRLADDSVSEAVQDLDLQVLSESSRNAYQVERMKRLMRTSVWALAEQLRAGDFAPAEAEKAFGDGGETLSIPLPGGVRMTLTGRIDRLDLCTDGDLTYYKILDYKTGNVKFDMAQVYYGLQLQLIVYLIAAGERLRREGKTAVPAGAFYYQVKDPVEAYVPGEEETALLRRRLNDLKVSGIVLNEPAAIAHLDRSVYDSGSSAVIPVAMKKDGSLKAASRTADSGQFRTMEVYVKHMIYDAAEGIMSGDAEILPYSYKGKTACDWCPYHGVCGFDRRVPGCRFRMLPGLADADALEKMEEKNGDGEDLDN